MSHSLKENGQTTDKQDRAFESEENVNQLMIQGL